MDFRDVRIVAAATGGYLTATLSSYLQPLVLSSLRDTFGLSPSLVGTLVAIDAGMCAMTAMLLGFLARRSQISYRTFGVAGVLMAVIANFLCSVTTSLPLIMCMRVIAGVGEGLAMGAGMGALGALPKPDRMIAAVLAMGSVVASIAIVLAPVLNVVGNAFRMYAYQGAVTCLIGICMLGLPKITVEPKRKADATPQARANARGLKLFVALFGSVLVGVSASMVWGFATVVGSRTGLAVAATATVISIATNFTILGSGLAAILGTRFGRTWPIGIAVVVECAALAFLFMTARPEAFAIGLCAILLVGMFIRPFIMGIGSLIDPSGGLTGSMSGAFRLGSFIGPMAGGVAIEFFNTPLVVVVLQFLLMPTIAVLFLSLYRSSEFTGSVQGAASREVTQT
jgi:MFS transporter, DHA1 family, inner membrane transport protein